MKPPDDNALREGIEAHKAGRYEEAEAAYQRALQARPEDPKTLYYLGLLHFHRQQTEQALACMFHSLDRAPSNAHVWNTLGSMLIRAQRPEEAKLAYRKVTQLMPAKAEGWYNLGICLRDEGDVEGAIAHLREAISRQPDFFNAYGALATLLYQLGRLSESAEVYRQWAERDPSNAQARHMAAATSGVNVPERASEDYIRALFDSFATGFDDSLGQLEYRAPQIIAHALTSRAPDAALDVLDAGCGTGLCGPLIRASCHTLTGIDLSEKMLERARERGCYDELVVAELCAFMRARPITFDAVVSADTLVYFGELREPLQAAYSTLRPNGLLLFTLEKLLNDSSADYRLEAHGRYAHSENYIRRALSDAGFELDALSLETLRQERLQDVPGFLVVARRL